jgi:hypothetical protein
MNDEPPEIFARVTPRGAPAELRARVLSAVDGQLADQSCATAGLSSSADRAPARPRWERILEIAVAASLLLGIGLNAWQWRSDVEPKSRFDDASPILAGISDLSETIALVTDQQTAQTFVEQYLAARSLRRASEEMSLQRYEQWIQELTHPQKDSPL